MLMLYFVSVPFLWNNLTILCNRPETVGCIGLVAELNTSRTAKKLGRAQTAWPAFSLAVTIPPLCYSVLPALEVREGPANKRVQQMSSSTHMSSVGITIHGLSEKSIVTLTIHGIDKNSLL